MNKEQALAELTAIEQRAAKLREIIEATVRPNRPNLTAIYYYIDSSQTVYNTTWENHHIDIARYEIGNVFLTEAEAEKELRNRKIYRQLQELSQYVPDWSSIEEKLFMVWDHPQKTCIASGTMNWHSPRQVYFRSETACVEAFRVIANQHGKQAVQDYLTWQ